MGKVYPKPQICITILCYDLYLSRHSKDLAQVLILFLHYNSALF